MKPVHDPSFDAKAHVARGYDLCAGAYASARSGIAPEWLPGFVDRLPEGGAVLDAGCGSGIPVMRDLARRGLAVTGVDISAAQVALARRNVPSATVLCGDVIAQDFPPGTFSGVTMLYALFHLPRDEHARLFSKVRAWLRPGGLFAVSLARHADAGYTEDDFFGASMYWSNYDERTYLPMLEAAGFDLLDMRGLGHGYGADFGGREESHPLVIVQKPDE